jgi:DNA-directed RNA polymerase specialized sigma24 family protein
MPVMRRPSRGGTRAEFERFVDDCAGDLLRTGYLIVWDLAESEDLVQETLVRVARRWPRVVWTSRSPTRAGSSSTWL